MKHRHTCQFCKKKRYQEHMVMINSKSEKNGKPEWACVTCEPSPGQLEIPLEPEPVVNDQSEMPKDICLFCGEVKATHKSVCPDCIKQEILNLSHHCLRRPERTFPEWHLDWAGGRWLREIQLWSVVSNINNYMWHPDSYEEYKLADKNLMEKLVAKREILTEELNKIRTQNKMKTQKH